MTIQERDQFATLQADWSPAYDITCDPNAPKPFQAIPRADPDACAAGADAGGYAAVRRRSRRRLREANVQA